MNGTAIERIREARRVCGSFGEISTNWYCSSVYPGDTYPCLPREWFDRLQGGTLRGPGWREYDTMREAFDAAMTAYQSKAEVAPAFGCVRSTIRLRSGKYFDMADPKPDQFTFADIAGGLAKICRYGGQCPLFYSVAEHLWHCAEVAKADGLPPPVVLAVLMHDAAEAFVGDMVKPLKQLCPDYAAIEKRVEAVIAAKYGLDVSPDVQAVVKRIDREMLIAERKGIFSSDHGVVKWTGEDEVRPIKVNFDYRFPDYAETMFTVAARRLGVEVLEYL